MEKDIREESGRIDYDVYVMTVREKVICTLAAAAVLFVIGYIFYHSILLSALLALLGLFAPKFRTKQIIKRRKEQLTLQFKDLMYSLSSAMSVGKSVEMGLYDALKDLRIIYPNENTDIIREVEYILGGIGTNHTTEEMFEQFAERAHLEDVDNFVDIYVTCKRMGGDMIETMRSTSTTIGEKIEVKQEIQTMIAGKRFEFHIMTAMPVVLIGILTVTSGDYMKSVFTTIEGHVVMTFAIFMFIVAYLIGKKIMEIEV